MHLCQHRSNRRDSMKPPPVKTLHGWHVAGISDATLDDCTLIIATYQRPRDVLDLMQQINNLASKPFEVIVVDGSTNSETEQKLLDWTTRLSPSFDLVYARSPAGLTRQRNVGIDLSSGKYVFFLDDDCIPQGNYFREVRSVFEKDEHIMTRPSRSYDLQTLGRDSANGRSP